MLSSGILIRSDVFPDTGVLFRAGSVYAACTLLYLAVCIGSNDDSACLCAAVARSFSLLYSTPFRRVPDFVDSGVGGHLGHFHRL